MSLSVVSSAGSMTTDDETSPSATADSTDEPSTPDDPPTSVGVTGDQTGETKDQRPTAFVVHLDYDVTAACDTRRRLLADPLSRYVPARVERWSAKRRAGIREKLRHRQVAIMTRCPSLVDLKVFCNCLILMHIMGKILHRISCVVFAEAGIVALL